MTAGLITGSPPEFGADNVRHVFSVRAAIDPEALPRILGQLARRRITPASLTSYRIRHALVVHFVVDGLAPATADIVASTLRSNVLVTEVNLATEIDSGSVKTTRKERSETRC